MGRGGRNISLSNRRAKRLNKSNCITRRDNGRNWEKKIKEAGCLENQAVDERRKERIRCERKKRARARRGGKEKNMTR